MYRLSYQISLLSKDLNPPLGIAGDNGPCYLLDRAKKEVRNPKDQQEIEIDLGDDGKLDGKHEKMIYDPLTVPGPGVSTLDLVEHAQARMDFRGIPVETIKKSLENFMNDYSASKSRKEPKAIRLEMDMMMNKVITWEDRKLKLTIAFRKPSKTKFVIITAYWTGRFDPSLPLGGCTSSEIGRLSFSINDFMKGKSLKQAVQTFYKTLYFKNKKIMKTREGYKIVLTFDLLEDASIFEEVYNRIFNQVLDYTWSLKKKNVNILASTNVEGTVVTDLENIKFDTFREYPNNIISREKKAGRDVHIFNGSLTIEFITPLL